MIPQNIGPTGYDVNVRRHSTTADFDEHVDTECTERTQPGKPDNPIRCFSDSESSRTTLRDSERSDTDDDLTVSEDEALFLEETSKAIQIISASRARREQTANDGGWEMASVPHASEFKTALLCLAQTIDPNMALQQVDARFPTESQISWEARGATVKGHFRDYGAAMKARFNSPNQDDWEWKQFGTSYTQLLALLQLDVKLLQDIWPQTSGGEAAYRRHWRLQVKHWTRSAQRQSTLIASATAGAGLLHSDEAAEEYRQDTVQHAKIHWNFMLNAMQKLCPPKVVIAAAESALRTTAQLWDFKPTTAMEAVMAKVEERLPLTFGGNPEHLAVYRVLQLLSDKATDNIWRHLKQARVDATGTSSSLGEVKGTFNSMEQATEAWQAHYAQRLARGCQRRNRLIEDAMQGTASEIGELFTELAYTTKVGFDATAMSVAYEAGDVWYGAQCYAIAYTEQAGRALAGWQQNLRDHRD